MPVPDPAALDRAQPRGDRLHPGRAHPRYAVLTMLHQQLLAVADAGPFAGRVVLDYGCGNRPYAPFLQERFEAQHSADFAGNPDAALVLPPDGRVPLPDASVDGVLSTQVLEHVADPAGYLAEAHRVLRPAGQLLLSTHGFWRYHPDPTDYWRWTHTGLTRLLAAQGFEVVAMRSVLGLTTVAMQLWQDATAYRLPKPLRGGYCRLIQAAIAARERRRDATRLDPNAAVYVVLARRTLNTEG